MSGESDFVFELVSAIAQADGVEPEDLEYSLHSYIDTDAVSRLAAMDHSEWRLEFEVPDHSVTIEGDGRIRIDGIVVRRTTLPQ